MHSIIKDISIIIIVYSLFTIDSCNDKQLNKYRNFNINSDEITIGNKNKIYQKFKTGKSYKRVVVFNTSSYGYLSSLGVQDKVIAVSDKRYFYDTFIVNNTHIYEIGDIDAFKVESILEISPDLIILPAYNVTLTSKINLLKKNGIDILYSLEYKESTPLYQAEWIKVFAKIFDKSIIGDSIYNQVVQNYNIIKNSKKKVVNKVVMTGFEWNGSWNVSPNNSNLAQMIRDCGQRYFFDKHTLNNYILNYEEMLKYGSKSDYWINVSDAKSLSEIIYRSKVSSKIKAFKCQKVFNNNNRMRRSANDYFELGAVRPDLIINDLDNIFQQKGNSLYFYKQLK